MSFLKDFREELSQAVNELVNIDENEASDINNNKLKEDEEMARRKQKSDVAANTNTDAVKETITEETDAMNIDTKEIDSDTEKDMTEANIDMSVLNELFGNNTESTDGTAQDLDSSEEKINDDDINLDNIDISDYLDESDEADKEDEQNETDSSVLKDLARNIQSTINDEKLEEMMTDDKESTKAALRGTKVEENYTYEDNQDSALATDEVAEVTKGTMIEGNIVSEGSMNIYGKIKGNVACRGKLVVCGTIVGSSRGAEIFTNNAKINGDVTSDGSLKIGNGTVIIGNVYGSSAVIAGAVQGDVDIHGPVVIDGTAVIQGNIRSRSVQINNGAAIEGMISQSYAEIDYTALFDKTFSK